MMGFKWAVVAVSLLCASTAQAKTHAGVVKGQVRGPQGPFDAVRTYQFTYRIGPQNGLAVAEYRFLFNHSANPRFLGTMYGARTIPFREVNATTPRWVVAQARVRFFDRAGKHDGSAKIYLFADELKPAGSWSSATGPKRVIPWARLFQEVKTTRTLTDALPSDGDYAAKLNMELVTSSSRIAIDQVRIVHLHYGRRVWRAFARAHWRGHRQKLAALPADKFWTADPVATAPTREPETREHKDAIAIYRVGIPVRGDAALRTNNALTVTTPYSGSAVVRPELAVTGRVQDLWRRLTTRVAIHVNDQASYTQIQPDGSFVANVVLRRGPNTIVVELDGPSHKISKTLAVHMNPRPRKALYWVCMQTDAEQSRSYSRRHTKAYVSNVFTTYYTTNQQRAQVQQQFVQQVRARYGTPAGWRAYGTSCTPYPNSSYAYNLYRSYSRYANPSASDRQRYRRLPGAIVNFQFKEQ